MRNVRVIVLLAWGALIVALFFDPLTVWLTQPDSGSPFRIGDDPVVIQGVPRYSTPYSMTNRIFWTMAVPLVPFAIMLLGHEFWRRVCPLSHASQFARMFGFERKLPNLNRKTGRVERILALLPSQSWLRRNHYYFQLGFLTLGVTGRILFYNSSHIALAAAFIFIISFAVFVGFTYGGKSWCNYFCPTAVVQQIYTGPGGLFDSKPHVERVAIKQSSCRASTDAADRSICVGCMTNCPDIDLENNYWKAIDLDQKRNVYYLFFGLVFGFYTYYFVYSGTWDYYMSGYWTHESDQFGALLKSGLYIGGHAYPVPKIVAAPAYILLCMSVSFGLFLALEKLYARCAEARGVSLSKAQRRHHMLTFSGFAAFTLFYAFAGRPNILLMPPIAIKLIDLAIAATSVAWLIRSLTRNADLYRHESLGNALRQELERMGFRSEAFLDGRSLDELSADEIYVLAKTLPNFSVDQKRNAYRAILADALATGQTRSSESLKLLRDLRIQLGLSDSDHDAIAHALGVEDPSLFNSDLARTVEEHARRRNYREFVTDLIQKGLAAGVAPKAWLARAETLVSIRQMRNWFNISDEEHAEILGEATNDQARLTERIAALSHSLKWTEAARFTLSHEKRPEASLLAKTIVKWQTQLVREIVHLAATLDDAARAAELVRPIALILGTEGKSALAEMIDMAPAALRDAIHDARTAGSASYFEIIEMSRPADVVFRTFLDDRDALVRALAVSALAAESAEGAALAREMFAHNEALPPLAEEIVARAKHGERSPIVLIMAELLVSSVFSRVDLSELAEIARRSTIERHPKGTQICRHGESSDGMFVLVRGETVAWVPEKNGREIIGRGSAGTVFGELGVISGRPRAASVEVTSDEATVVAIPRRAVDDLLGRDASAVQSILKTVTGYLLDNMAAASAKAKQELQTS
ncbi:cyclic nucleotide-binding domain-containing protein [Methylosinus sp. C49]|uniref:cyclic nucleotide-binding domain-containing protein n=1 Tax=Methylosinus sp. C49 TaxID=2699395 RepID=UPI00137A0A05|nr:cyclic nucleotide-binding domain-containing protein [Methylosinus sp. C49]